MAQEQSEGRITQQVARKLRGSTSLSEPFWQIAAQLRVGWGQAREQGVRQDHLTVLQRMQAVRYAIERNTKEERVSEEDDESSDEAETAAMRGELARGDGEVVQATPKAVEAAWQAVKKRFSNGSSEGSAPRIDRGTPRHPARP